MSRSALVGLLLISGCVRYAAPVGTETRLHATQIEVESATGTRRRYEGRVVLTIERIPPELRLLGATLTRPTYPPCGSRLGWSPNGVSLRSLGPPWDEEQESIDAESESNVINGQALGMGREPARKPEDPLVAGEQISLMFYSWPVYALASGPSRLDLLVKTPAGNVRCLPIAIADEPEGLDFEQEERFTLGVDVGIEGFTNPLGSVSQFVTFPVVVGAWLGPWHVAAGGGFVGSGCPDTRCPVPGDDGSRIDYSNGYLAVGGVDAVLWERGEIGLGAALRYRAMYLTADTFAGPDSEAFWAHGPVLAPSFFGANELIEPGEIGGARELVAALEVPVGLVFTGKRGTSVAIGANLRLQLTVF